MYITATTKQLSVCPCGYSALRPEIPLGTEYKVDPLDSDEFIWRCGECGTTQTLVCIKVLPRLPGQKGGYLPLELFQLNTQPTTT